MTDKDERTGEAEREDQEIDRLAREWKEGNGGAEDFPERLFLWCDKKGRYLRKEETDENDYMDAFMDTIEAALHSYDPQKGQFTHFFRFKLSRRLMDYDMDRKRRKAMQSFDDDSEEGKTPPSELVPGRSNVEERQKELVLDEQYYELASLMLNFAQRHKGKSNNAQRQKWYRIFYTEDMTRVWKEGAMRFSHERDMISAMLLPYLDFYMRGVCRSIPDIRRTPLKAYRELVDARADVDAPPPLPLPADVSLSYLERCEGQKATAQNRSNYHRYYQNEVRQLLQC